MTEPHPQAVQALIQRTRLDPIGARYGRTPAGRPPAAAGGMGGFRAVVREGANLGQSYCYSYDGEDINGWYIDEVGLDGDIFYPSATRDGSNTWIPSMIVHPITWGAIPWPAPIMFNWTISFFVWAMPGDLSASPAEYVMPFTLTPPMMTAKVQSVVADGRVDTVRLAPWGPLNIGPGNVCSREFMVWSPEIPSSVNWPNVWKVPLASVDEHVTVAPEHLNWQKWRVVRPLVWVKTAAKPGGVEDWRELGYDETEGELGTWIRRPDGYA